MKNKTKEKPGGQVRDPRKISSYFLSEIPALAVVTVSGLIYNIGMVAGPYFEGRMAQCLYDISQGKAGWHAMLRLALIYVAAILAVQAMRAVKRFGVRRFANNVSRKMRVILYNSLVHAGPKELFQENLGSLLTKAISDVDACVEGMRKFTTEIFDTGVVMITYIVMLVYYDWRLTILCCMFTPLAYIAADRLKTRVTAANSAYKKSSSSLNSMTMDRVGSAVTYRVFGREANRDEAYEKSLTDYEKKSAVSNLYGGSLAPLYDAIAMIGAVMILYFGARNVRGTGWTAWDIAAFTTYLSCFTKLAVKASHAAKLFNAVQKASVSWKRIQPLMKQPVEDDEHLLDTPVEKTELSFSNVCTGYQDTNQLTGITFTARPGEIIGITGQVASGKSLLGKIFLDEVPSTGSITVNGKDFRSLSREDRLRLITYMGHDPELLSTSIADNIALGKPVDVNTYLKETGLDRDLKDMNASAETAAGSGGTMLSGGQQARVALARSLAHARSILVLDDPFASVDRATETEILKVLREKYSDRVILLFSHRLYHFPEFDRVLFLHDGTSDFHTHDEMMKKEPGYRALYEEQMKGGDYDERSES
ncbi:MAG: ABC transporter ATP-binding protein [Lachnospiraceae bacterium]|jgi:ATP-binding cassette subfamily B multidrug efflux pump